MKKFLVIVYFFALAIKGQAFSSAQAWELALFTTPVGVLTKCEKGDSASKMIRAVLENVRRKHPDLAPLEIRSEPAELLDRSVEYLPSANRCTAADALFELTQLSCRIEIRGHELSFDPIDPRMEFEHQHRAQLSRMVQLLEAVTSNTIDQNPGLIRWAQHEILIAPYVTNTLAGMSLDPPSFVDAVFLLEKAKDGGVRLRNLCRLATPAGRLYAFAALRARGEAVGFFANLENIEPPETKVKFGQYCVFETMTAREIFGTHINPGTFWKELEQTVQLQIGNLPNIKRRLASFGPAPAALSSAVRDVVLDPAYCSSLEVEK